MASEYELRERARKYGMQDLDAWEKADLERYDRKSLDESVQGMEALLALAFICAGLYLLRFLAVYAIIFFGALVWIFCSVMWPRMAPILLTSGIFVGLFWGIGSSGRIQFWWVDMTISSGSDPMWGGPVTWACVVVAGSFLLYIPLRLRLFPMPAIAEDSQKRPAQGLMVNRALAWLNVPTCLMPLIVFLPAIVWTGLFGEGGIAAGETLSRMEILRLMFDRPVDILVTGFKAAVFWPEGFFAKTAMVIIYLGVAVSTAVAMFYRLIRSDQEKIARAEMRAREAAKA